MLKPWWQQWPRRLGNELARLKCAGISYRLDREAFRNDGAGALYLTMEEGPYRGLNLIARFPATYPYTRFEIFCDEISLSHHQHPFVKSLCLIGQAAENWHTTDTVADFLTTRLSKVITAGQALDGESAGVALEEDPQGEPFSAYYTYHTHSIVVTASSMKIPPEATQGYLELGYSIQHDINQFFLLRILDEDGNTLAQNEPEYFRKYHYSIKGKWVRRSAPVATDDPDEFWKILREEHPDFLKKTDKTSLGGQTFITLVGVVFPEEWSLRTNHDGWTFMARTVQIKKQKAYGGGNTLIRTGYAGRSDMAQRVPFFTILQQKKVAVIGTGCLGGPSALELARCGVGEIRMLDHDVVDPGTTVRWPFGIHAAGQPKVAQLARYIQENYPFTKTRSFGYRLGVTSLSPRKEVTDLDVLRVLLDGVDLIYDATTELGLQHLLSDLAAQKKIPYVGISTTLGAWGGIVVKINPDTTQGCWSCYRHFITEHREIEPPQDNNGSTQPNGCGDVTYIGAGFDAQLIALEGVRTAVSALTSGEEGGYPPLTWDLSILSLRDPDGLPTPPTWTPHKLAPHPECQCAQHQKGFAGFTK